MINHLYPDFLHDDRAYRLSEAHWLGLWEQLDPRIRDEFGWRQPWFEPLPRALGEGNPIFSAVSPVLRRGIRVIQHAPTESGLEIQAWPDTFGGSAGEHDSISELVISCALSKAASLVALSLLEPWVSGGELSFHFDEGGQLLPMTSTSPVRE
jgi:hypothetical protein